MIEVNANNAAEAAKTVKGGCVVGPSTVRYSPTLTQLIGALLRARQKIRNPPKDSVNPHYKSKYADLATVLDTVTGPLLECGLLLIQLPCEMDDAPALTTRLTHASGEWIETTIKLRPSKSDPQGVGSATTYARRYAVLAVLGITGEDDDDGNAASKPAQHHHDQPRESPEPDLVVDAKTVASFVAAFAKCQGEADYKVVCDRITAGVQSKEINSATRQALRATAQATLERIKQTPARA